MQIFSKDIIDKLEKIKAEYDYLCNILTYEEVLTDNKLCAKYQKQLDTISDIATGYITIKNLQAEQKQLSTQIVDSEQEKALFNQEILNIDCKIQLLQQTVLKQLNNLNAQNQNITIEVVNIDCNDGLVQDIINAYQNFCKQNNIICDVDAKNPTILKISGLNVKNIFIKQAGIHTAKQSSCKVFVYDTFNLQQPTFTEHDIKIEVCRSSGAGGQHINTTDSSIKVTHLPTNITAICQDERSQFQNKQKALQNLKTKVLDYYNNQKINYTKQQKALQIKQNKTVMLYDYDNNIVVSKINNNKYILTDFLSGKVL